MTQERNAYVEPLSPPGEDLPGSQWTTKDCIRFLEWAAQPLIRSRILSRLSLVFEKKGFRLQPADLEDLWSELCTRLQIRVQAYKPEKGRLMSFLVYGLFHNRHKQLRIRKQRHAEISEVENSSEHRRAICRPQAEELHDKLNAQELTDQLERLIRTALTDDEQILIRKCLQEKRPAEIAAEVGISPGLVRVRLYRARQKLKSAWSESSVKRGSR